MGLVTFVAWLIGSQSGRFVAGFMFLLLYILPHLTADIVHPRLPIVVLFCHFSWLLSRRLLPLIVAYWVDLLVEVWGDPVVTILWGDPVVVTPTSGGLIESISMMPLGVIFSAAHA